MASSSKRSRHVLSIEKKLEIISRLEKGESGTNLAKIYDVGKATISDIKKNKDTILKFVSKLDSEDGSQKRKTMKGPKDEKLENAMFLWFIQRRSKGEPISGPLLCEKALVMNQKLGGPNDFKASTGWLKNFKSRHGIRELEIQGESLAGDAPAAEKFKQTFCDFVKNEGYCLDNIYNTDETGLNWRALPRKSLAAKQEAKAPGYKISKDRVTILVTANATGTHALPLLMIGKSKNPRCFKNVKCLPLTYKAQKSAWMTSSLFLEWYKDDFIPNVKAFRKRENKTGKVLLLMDNAPSHPEVDVMNSVDQDFQVMFLPPNVTALIQPMDQGVIYKMKCMYKKEILRRLLLAENEEEVVSFSKKLNLKECSYMVADAWNLLTKENLSRAWIKLLPPIIELEPFDDLEDLREIVDLGTNIPGFRGFGEEDAESWLANDDDPGFQIMDDNDIVAQVQENQEALTDEETAEDDSEGKPSGPSHEEALRALNTAMEWFDKQDESSPSQLLLLKRMRDLAAKKRQSSLIQKRINDFFI